MPRARRRFLRVTAGNSDGSPKEFQADQEREAGTGSVIPVTRKGYMYYRARFWVTDDLGARRAKYVYAKTFADAERRMRAKLREDSHEIGTTTTVAKFMKEWLDQVRADNRVATWATLRIDVP